MQLKTAEGHPGRPRIVQGVIAVAIALFAILTVGFGRGGIAGTSISEYDRILPDRTDSFRGGKIGISRPIRSDEWAVSIPFVLAQCRSPEFFPRVNPRINGGMDMFVETPCAPVWDWTAFGQFHNWGFFLFGADHGLAWCWWTRYILLPLFAFLFLARWCGEDFTLAGAGAVAITLGAPTQWWDTTIPYHLVYFFAVLVFARAVAASRDGWRAALSGFGLFVSLASYCLVMYPPFSLLLLPALLILLLADIQNAMWEGRGWWRVAVAAIALAGVVAELVYFAVQHGETLKIMGSSSYPGARFIHGGSLKMLCERTVIDWMSCCTAFVRPLQRLNQCEAAEYMGLTIPLVGGVGFMLARRGGCRVLVALLLYALLLLAWCLFRWPDCLARMSGLYMVLPKRATVIAGFVLMVCALRCASLTSEGFAAPRCLATVVLAFYLGGRAFAFSQVTDIWNWFYSSGKMTLLLETGILLSVLSVWGLLRGRKHLFAASLLAFSVLTGCLVHPLSEGTSPVYDKVLSQKILKIDADEPGIWIANDRVIGQLLVALGVNAYSGTQTYCDGSFWQTVDPQGVNRPVWNRYGHRYIIGFEEGGPPNNRKRLDAIFFSLDEAKTRALGVRYIVWRGRPLSLAWLNEVASLRNDHIYEVRQNEEERVQP